MTKLKTSQKALLFFLIIGIVFSVLFIVRYRKNDSMWHASQDGSFYNYKNSDKAFCVPCHFPKIRWINFECKFRIDHCQQYMNLFQTADGNDGMRLEFDVASNSFFLLLPSDETPNGLIGYQMKLPKVTDEWLTLKISTKGNHSEAQILSAENLQVLTRVTYQNRKIKTTKFLVGQGFSNDRCFHGEIKDLRVEAGVCSPAFHLKLGFIALVLFSFGTLFYGLHLISDDYRKIRDFFNTFDVFNLLRSVAVFSVFVFHFWIIFTSCCAKKDDLWYFHTPAWPAMWIFFSLSGYLLGKGFVREKYTTDWKGVGTFYVSRLFRILPMYLFALIFMTIFINPSFFINTPKAWIALLTFTYNGRPGVNGVGALWFISTIVQMYFVLPFFVKFVIEPLRRTRISLWRIWGTLALAFFALRVILVANKVDYYEWCYTFSPMNFDLFLGGVLLSYLTETGDSKKKRGALLPLTCCLFGLLLYFTYYNADSSPKNFLILQCVAPTLFLLVVHGLIFSWDYRGRPKCNNKSIVVRVLEFLGMVSFPFYIYHSNIVYSLVSAAELKKLNIFVLFGICLLATIVFSMAIYYFFERPMKYFVAQKQK